MTLGEATTCKLPIGMRTFRDVPERECYQVDKTEANTSPAGALLQRSRRNTLPIQ